MLHSNDVWTVGDGPDIMAHLEDEIRSDEMESFLIDWCIDDIEAQCLLGADYVKGKNSKEAKQLLLSILQAKCPRATCIKIGRASRRTAPDDEFYIN
jgi:hypothetical protein